MTLEEQNEHANALMAIAATRHVQFAKQLLTLAQQHLEHSINATPTSPRRNSLSEMNILLLTIASLADRLPPQ